MLCLQVTVFSVFKVVFLLCWQLVYFGFVPNEMRGYLFVKDTHRGEISLMTDFSQGTLDIFRGG